MSRKAALLITLAGALACAGAASSRPNYHPGDTVSHFERFVATADFDFTINGIGLGKDESAACKSDSAPIEDYGPTARYQHFVCAIRTHNAWRLLLIKFWFGPPSWEIKFRFMRWE